MNQLSQLIYWADVVGAADGFFIFLAVLCGFGSFAGVACWIGFKSDGTDISKWFAFGPALGMLLFGLLAVATPSKDTMYAIAASEMGEKAINTPTAQKAFKALNAWLDRQIEGEKKPETAE